MLRYQLYECNDPSIPIEKELSYLKNYVELQTLRRNSSDIIDFIVADELRNFSLPPLLLIPIIENAFKHVSNFTDRKNEIRIELKKEGQIVQLRVFNTSDSSGKETGGIGLRNLKRRLELLFPHRHTLDIKKTTGRFEVNLILELA
jgi:LytS/YehU family sensor histidine kinase